MADILLDEQGFPSTPSAGQGLWWHDSSNSRPCYRDDSGIYYGGITKAITAQIASHSADTYYGLGLQLPSFSMQAGMSFVWEFEVSKGAAGTTAPIYQLRIGAAQAVADTSRLSLTGPAQTAAADTAIVIVSATCRNVGAAAVLRGSVWLQHNLAATGFANTGPAGFAFVAGSSAGFDNTALQGQYIGLSVNPGTSGAWVVERATATMTY